MDFVEIEAAGTRMLEQFPFIKHTAKRVYQRLSVLVSKEKITSEGMMIKVSPDDDYEYFYGYYDKSPWDATDRYMIVLRVSQTYKKVAPKEPGTVCLIDTVNNNALIEIGTTNSWNVQQGCMAQWLGPDFKKRVIYNDYRNGDYCAVIFNIEKMTEEKVLPRPVYDVSKDGSFALSLDFNRLHRMRPGYGYSNQPDRTKSILCPDSCCIWKVDISNGTVIELLKYTDFAEFERTESMDGAEHKVNHLMISPSGKRFMVLHRWFQKGRKHTRLVTVNSDGTGLYNLSDDVFVSHCFWKNDGYILGFLRKKGDGDHYYLLKDKTQEYQMLWPELRTDGHCSYSPDRELIVTDTYPNRKRIASVYLCSEKSNSYKRIARVFSPFRYDNDCRCDLHPRWNHAGTAFCIDSVHEGKRGLYYLPLQSSYASDHTDNNQLQGKFNESRYNAIISQLKKYQYISFDIFDTLLYRDVMVPGDVFYLMESVIPQYINLHISNFAQKRIEAEKKARSRCDTEITLNEIYNSFSDENVLAYKEQLKQVEIDIELRVSHPNERVRPLYEWCVVNHKNIYLISDMYLQETVIERLVRKGGYSNYKHLYVSSECKYRKAQEGSLFRYVCQNEGIQPGQLIHIGDSRKNDYENARRVGCNAVLLKKKKETGWFITRGRWIASEKRQLGILQTFCRNRRMRLDDQFESFGYEALGPLLFGFSQWLHSQLIQKGIHKVFFFSRDGMIMKKAFDLLYPDHEIKTEYLQVSRRSLRVPQLWIDMNYEKVLSSFPAASVQSIIQFFDSVGLNYYDYKDLCISQEINEEYMFSLKEAPDNDRLRSVYQTLKPIIYQNSVQEYQALQIYLEQMDFKGKIAVVDIGWRGSMQAFLFKLGQQMKLNLDMEGYYMGLSAGAVRYHDELPINFHGYLFDCVANKTDKDLRNPFVGVIETLFLGQTGSVMNYSLDSEGMCRVHLYPNKYEIAPGQLTMDAQNVRKIQEGAIIFIRDAADSFLRYLNFSTKVVFNNIYMAGMHPGAKELHLFGDMEFQDGETTHLAKPRSVLHYIVKPKDLIRDFYSSRWKIGFMKRLLKLPLPYGKIYEVLKKI